MSKRRLKRAGLYWIVLQRKKCSSKFKTEWLSELAETELDDEDKVVSKLWLGSQYRQSLSTMVVAER